MAKVENAAALRDALFDAVSDFAKRNSEITVSEIITASCLVILQAAKSSPEFDPALIAQDVADTINAALRR